MTAMTSRRNWVRAFFGERRPTTPDPPVDVAKAIPDFAALARTTVRLHPRRGKVDPDASKIGGTFAWPESEEWPRCAEHDCPYVTALQLREEDVPELGFRPGADLFQVLWCPNDHDDGLCPAVRVYWRQVSQMDRLAPEPPETTIADRYYLPKECRLYPERVVEYPDAIELSKSQHQLVEECRAISELLANPHVKPVGEFELPEDEMHVYEAWLSTADGTKVGGYPSWVQFPEYPQCACGERMDYLMSFASAECDAVTWARWLPLDDRNLLSKPWLKMESVSNAAHWMFGDCGCMYLFVCRRCGNWPTRAFMQCS